MRNIRDRLPGESDEQYEKRLRRFGSTSYKNFPPRTVAQDKRDALKARNRKRAK